jgi:hypothetical protein
MADWSKMKRFVVDVTPELHKALRLKSVELDKDVTVILRSLALGWLEGDIELPEGRGHPEDKPKEKKPTT